MTGFASPLTGTEVDVETLVGGMDEVSCESPSHGTLPHGTGPATHYCMYMHDCVDDAKGDVYAVCLDFAAYVSALTGRGFCAKCGLSFMSVDEFVKIVGPVTK